MTTRKYSSRSQQTTLSSPITATATTMTVVNGASIMGGKTLTGTQTYTVVIDPDTALEEIVDVTLYSSGNTLTITRGVDGPTPGTGSAHSAGAVIRHMAIGRDYQEANDHIESLRANSATAHGIPLATIVLTSDTGTVANGMIAANAVTTAKITDLNVTTGKIADSAITSAKIADLGIATGDIADLAITTGKIANAAVTTAKIEESAVTNSRIAADAITSDKIADGTIVAGDIADGAITSGKILNDTIVNADVNSAAAIAYSKLNLAGAITSSDIVNETIVNTDISTSAQIAYGKLNLTNSIVNGDINASAAIALSKLATDPLARANHTGTQTASTVSDFDTQVRTSRLDQMAAPTGSVSANSQKITNLATPTSNTDAATKAYADLMIPLTQKGVANGVAELDADGLVPVHHLPALSITTTQVVTSQAAMLALTAQTGDVAVRTDVNKTFILTATPASTLGNWQELLTPTDSVLSVDGLTGAVSLSSTYATVANAANKLPLAGGTMSGAIAMGTNKITGVGDPTNAQDVVTKYYLDNVVLAPSNLTGPITSVANATSIASQTGTGTKFVMDNTPTLITPVLGVATATSINGTTIPTSKTLVATDSTTYVVPSQTGNSGKYLTTDGTTSSWGSVAGYSAPTLGSTSIASGSTVSNVDALTINSTTIPTSKTLVDTDSSQTLTNKTLTGPVINLVTSAQTASYTLVLSDSSDLVEMSNASANNLTVPLNSSVAFPVGTQIHILQTGAGQTTVVATGGVTINASPGLKLRAQWSAATLIKRATDTWVLVGDLSA
jgi:hypothetical protein